jgi:hypothetical protein
VVGFFFLAAGFSYGWGTGVWISRAAVGLLRFWFSVMHLVGSSFASGEGNCVIAEGRYYEPS